MKKLIALATTTLLTASVFATGISSAQLTRSKAEAERDLRNTVFSGIARIGDSALCPKICDWEQGLGANTGQWSQKRNNDFRSGQAKHFNVAYTAANRQVTFTLAGNILRYTIEPGKKMDAVILSAQTVACSSIRFDNLVFKNNAIGAGLRPNVQDGGARWLRINSPDLNRDWNMSGKVTFTWVGQPKGRQMNMEVRAMEAVPEPGSMMALAAGIGAFIARRKKKNAA